MTFSEIFNSANRLTDKVKTTSADLSHSAHVQADLARTGRVNIDGDPTTDLVLLGAANVTKKVSGSVYVTAKAIQSEILTPSRAISAAIGDVQQKYEVLLKDTSCPKSRHGLALSFEKLDHTLDHFATQKNKPVAQLAREQLPKLLGIAKSAVDAKRELEHPRAMKLGSIESHSIPVHTRNTQSGQVVVTNERRTIINMKPQTPSLKKTLLSLVNF